MNKGNGGNMTIKEIIDNTKNSDSDISGIKVAIQDKNKLTFMGNPTEIYFGELSDIPIEYLDLEIIERSQICASSDENREGANVLVVSLA